MPSSIGNTHYPVPNLKKIIHGVMAPEMRALIDTIQPEVEFMRMTLQDQSISLARLQELVGVMQDQLIAYSNQEHATAVKVLDHEHGKVGFQRFYEHEMKINNQVSTMQYTVRNIKNDMINIHLWKNETDRKLVTLRDTFKLRLDETNDALNRLIVKVNEQDSAVTELTELKSQIVQLDANYKYFKQTIESKEPDWIQFREATGDSIDDLKTRVKKIEAYLSQP